MKAWSQCSSSLVADQLKETPTITDRQIGLVLGVDHKTVGAVRSDLVGRGEIPHVESRLDSIGRQQPTSKAKPAASAPVDKPLAAIAEPTPDPGAHSSLASTGGPGGLVVAVDEISPIVGRSWFWWKRRCRRRFSEVDADYVRNGRSCRCRRRRHRGRPGARRHQVRLAAASAFPISDEGTSWSWRERCQKLASCHGRLDGGFSMMLVTRNAGLRGYRGQMASADAG